MYIGRQSESGRGKHTIGMYLEYYIVYVGNQVEIKAKAT